MRSRNISLISIDLDGTLMKDRRNQELSQLEIFRARVHDLLFMDPRIVIVLNSGASVGLVEGVLGFYGLCSQDGEPTRHICESGCLILEYQHGNVARHNLVEMFCSNEQIRTMVLLRNEIEKAFPDVWPEWGMSYGVSYNATSTEKLDQIAKFLRQRIGMDSLNLFRGNVAASVVSLDIVPKPISKAFALKYVADLYGLPLDCVAHIGDSENDWHVFDMVKLPITVSNASRDTKQHVIAKKGIITESGYILGVCEALEMIREERS